jgi:GNAT superfamily N-acetyltransferase
LNRGGGVGRRLLEAAERWASANDLALIRVRSNIVRSNAHRSYERRAYDVEKTSSTFVKSLNPV